MAPCYNGAMNKAAMRLMLLCALAFFQPFLPLASAQSSIALRISPPDLTTFPDVSLFANVTDAEGRRIEGLPATVFSVLEDGEAAPILSLSESVVGAREIFVLNSSIGLRLRDSLGRSRFDLARNALLDWWSRPEAAAVGIDDLTLVVADGTLAAHRTAAADLASALANHAPTFAESPSGFNLLFESLNYAGDPLPKPGMPTYLVFVTALLLPPREVSLENIITRAQSSGTAIFPVLIGPGDTLEQPEAGIMQQLAEATGGRVILFDEARGLDDLADLIFQQRTQYEIRYRSSAVATGPHEVQVQLRSGAVDVVSDPRTFVTNVLPPELTLVDLPQVITRQSDDPQVEIAALPPTRLEISLAVTFPDGYPRPLTSSQLYVDNEPVALREQEPFDRLTWDLSPYLLSGEHSVQVGVTDSLGLESFTTTRTVRIEVKPPKSGLAAYLPALLPLGVALLVLLAGMAAAVRLLRNVPRSEPRETDLERAHRRRVAQRQAMLHRRPPEEPAEAYLQPQGFDDESAAPIPLVGTDVLIGRDPSLAAVPLLHPSVDRLHARIVRTAGGEFILQDQGSEGGTWVNDEPVSEDGRALQHGDLVAFGSVILRFTLVNPPPMRAVQVRTLEGGAMPSADIKDLRR